MWPGPGKLQSFPDPLADFQGAALRQGRGGEGKRRRRKRKGKG